SSSGSSADGSSSAAERDEDSGAEQVLHFRHVTMPAGRLVGWTVDRQGERALVAMSDSHDELLAVTKLYLVDLLGGQPPLLLRESTREIGYGPGEFSPDGTRALIGRSRTWTQSATLASTTEVLDLRTGESAQLWPELDHWISPVWLDGGPGRQLAFGEVSVAGGAVIAVASSITEAPHPVRIDPATGTLENLPNPADPVEQSGSLAELTATAADGTEVRAWLRLPE